jgi:hypothetical protein
VRAAAYLGTVQVGPFAPASCVISVLGDEAIVGRSVTDRFSITFDHGQQVIVTAPNAGHTAESRPPRRGRRPARAMGSPPRGQERIDSWDETKQCDFGRSISITPLRRAVGLEGRASGLKRGLIGQRRQH